MMGALLIGTEYRMGKQGAGQNDKFFGFACVVYNGMFTISQDCVFNRT